MRAQLARPPRAALPPPRRHCRAPRAVAALTWSPARRASVRVGVLKWGQSRSAPDLSTRAALSPSRLGLLRARHAHAPLTPPPARPPSPFRRSHAQAIEKFTADATRFACANAGDTLEDANFDQIVANGAILNLTNEEEWAAAVLGTEHENVKDKDRPELRDGRDDEHFADVAFANEIARLVTAADVAFTEMRWRDGVIAGFFELQAARDFYRDVAVRSGIKMHRGLCRRFVETQVMVLAPICPHWATHVWMSMLGHARSPLWGPWPTVAAEDANVTKAWAFLKDSVKALRAVVGKEKKDKNAGAIYVADTCARARRGAASRAR